MEQQPVIVQPQQTVKAKKSKRGLWIGLGVVLVAVCLVAAALLYFIFVKQAKISDAEIIQKAKEATDSISSYTALANLSLRTNLLGKREPYTIHTIRTETQRDFKDQEWRQRYRNSTYGAKDDGSADAVAWNSVFYGQDGQVYRGYDYETNEEKKWWKLEKPAAHTERVDKYNSFGQAVLDQYSQKINKIIRSDDEYVLLFSLEPADVVSISNMVINGWSDIATTNDDTRQLAKPLNGISAALGKGARMESLQLRLVINKSDYSVRSVDFSYWFNRAEEKSYRLYEIRKSVLYSNINQPVDITVPDEAKQ